MLWFGKGNREWIFGLGSGVIQAEFWLLWHISRPSGSNVWVIYWGSYKWHLVLEVQPHVHISCEDHGPTVVDHGLNSEADWAESKKLENSKSEHFFPTSEVPFCERCSVWLMASLGSSEVEWLPWLGASGRTNWAYSDQILPLPLGNELPSGNRGSSWFFEGKAFPIHPSCPVRMGKPLRPLCLPVLI